MIKYKISRRSRTLVYLLFLLTSTSDALAADACRGIFTSITQQSKDLWSPQAGLQRREDLIKSLVDSQAVAALRIHPDGSRIPIIMINKDSLKNPAIAKIITETTAIGMDIGWNPASPDIDHGFARSGDRLIDYGKHGDRIQRDPKTGEVVYGSRELNETGLVHRSFTDYVSKYRNPSSPVMIEIAYFAEPRDIELSQAFHNMRRAGVIRNIMESIVRYEANMNPAYVNGWFLRHPRTMVGMEYTENCVSYCLGSQIGRQIDFMKWKIGEMGLNADTLLAKASISTMVSQAMKQLSEADWKDPAVLQPEMLSLPKYREVLDSALPLGTQLTIEQKNDLIAYLVSIVTSSGYRAVIEKQGSENAIGIDSNPFDHRPRAFRPRYPELDSRNPSAIALLVYDSQPGDENLFLEGRFEYSGRAYGIYRTENSPSGYRQVPLPQPEKSENIK